MFRRKYGSLDYEFPILGFGVMRVPEKEENGETVNDWEKSIDMLRRGADLGVDFYDTHPMYCRNESEHILGEALQGVERKIYVQTKCPLWKDLEEGESWRGFLEQSMKNLQLDYLDFYIAHALKWETFQEKGDDFLKMVRQAIDEGIVGHTGFSSHDKPENVMKIIDSGEFESMTIQYNLVDRQYEKCIERAAEKGMAVVIMGPVAGGILEELPNRKKHILPEKISSTPEMALRFVWRNPHVSLAISGMSSIEQLEENVKTASTPEPLTEKDYEKILEEFEDLKELADLYCTRCEYCLPCPQDINIPGIFNAVNLLKVYDAPDQAKFLYSIFTKPDKEGNDRSPAACIECRECEEKCPQNIPIMKQLKEAKEIFEEQHTE